jgi:serine-type D-Ala-D-Ala carboxypeptidase/endopeptidase (penicillin-binding protein 4)
MPQRPWAGSAKVTAVAALAMLNVFGIGAAGVLAWKLPARLAQWKVPAVATERVTEPGTVLPGTGAAGPAPTAAGLAASLSGLLSGGMLGSHVTAVVADLGSGKVLFTRDGGSPSAPASTAKLATAVAALDTLGPGARLTTRVVQGGSGGIILVGGGDPTLAAGRPPSGQYPEPASLQALAASTAHGLRARHLRTVKLGYDTSLYSGPALAPGWPQSYVSTGNVTDITALEVDQGRLLPDGLPQDADVPGNQRPRSGDPVGDAVAAFTTFLRRDGIRVAGAPRPATAVSGDSQLAAVTSPPLAAIVAQMLTESNNVIAENLARHVAIATGHPATFGGAASAVTSVLRGLGAGTGVHLADGSGLSPQDRIPAATLVRLVDLAAATAHPDLRAAVTGLPVAGFSGTLSAGQSVFGDLDATARGMVRAKTGNLNTVVSLAGLVEDRNGVVLTFAFMADKVPARDLSPAAAQIGKLADALAACGCN